MEEEVALPGLAMEAASKKKGANHPLFDWKELSSEVVDVIANIFIKEHETSPLCDTSDMARTAAACMIIGNPSSIKGIASLSQLGRMLYAAISPRLGAETGLTEDSMKPALEKQLKEWNLPKGKKKEVMWKRIKDQVTPCHETACPCAIATRDSMKAFREERFRLSKTLRAFCLSLKELNRLPFLPRSNKQGAYKLFTRQDLKEAARTKYPLWGDFKRLRDNYARNQADLKPLHEEWEARKAKVVDALVGENYRYERHWAIKAVKGAFALPYLCCYRHARLVPADLESQLEKTVPIVAEKLKEMLKAKQAQQAQQAQNQAAQQQAQQAESELDDDDDVEEEEEREEEEETGGPVDDGVGGTSSSSGYPDFIPL